MLRPARRLYSYFMGDRPVSKNIDETGTLFACSFIVFILNLIIHNDKKNHYLAPMTDEQKTT